ncbi:MAG: hypothetical protein AB7E30_08895 [Lawsonibacter sp.]
MREYLRGAAWSFVQDYALNHQLPMIWEVPILKYAAADDPLFPKLRQIVVDSHYLPQDYLPEASTVLSWFIPFVPSIAQSNLDGPYPSSEWQLAYHATNTMAEELNLHLCQVIGGLGDTAVVPTDTGRISDQQILSRWSQRHVAYIAGHGTFGMNNMLISDRGCVGRYFSIVTTLPLDSDPRPTLERCLYKRSGTCGLCMKRCTVNALSPCGFERRRCFDRCRENRVRGGPNGANICGKCVVGLPCSFSSLDFNTEP